MPLKTTLLLLAALALSPPPAPGRQAAAGGVTFVDASARAGLAFKHVSSPEKRYIVESMSGGVALLDFDNDGHLDVYFVNSLTVDLLKSKGKTRSVLYRNRGDGSFEDVTDRAGVGDIGWGMGAAVADYDNDGFQDIYVTCVGPNRLLKNRGDGTFEDVTKRAGVGDPRWSAGASFVDYDADGRLDLFVSNYVAFDFENLPEFGKDKTCQFKGVAVQCGPRGLPGEGDSLYRNNGDGTFTDVTKKAGVADPNGYYGMGVISSDFDEDGLVDIFVANDSTPNFLYKNNGDGTFKEVGFISGTALNENGASQGCMGVTVADYDHDGRLDLFITNFDDDYNVLYRNEGRGSFTDASYAAKVAAVSFPYVGWGTKFFDYDNDGWVDIFVANGHVYPQIKNFHQRNFVHRNNRDGKFTELGETLGAPFLEKRAARGAAFGDFDNDGDVDVFVNNLGGAAQLLRNDGGNANNSVLVKLVGTRSNRDGVGARVRVVSGELAQKDEVRSGDSYLSQSDLRLHFGLEKRPRVDLIEVRWPSGAVDKVTDAKVNSIITVAEGKGVVSQKPYRGR